MPPKQKQVKKGPAYKPATPFKDMVPSTVKQPPRDPKPIKVPEPAAQNVDKNGQAGNENITIFEQWPTQQVIKAHDFGIGSETKFIDKHHDAINEFLNHEISSKQKMFNWKHLHELQLLKEKQNQKQEQSEEQNEQIEARSSVNLETEKNNPSQKSIEQKRKPIVVIETYLRQQTEEQIEKRKKQEAEKAEKAAKDKKKGKKQEPKEEGPMQVSDVKMSNIVVKKYMCPSGIWIGSQLQTIKIRDLRDVYTEEPVWKKIYPQQNGVPQITKSGKYWVKLYYMGKLVKVEVDDRVPLNANIKQLFPKSEKQNEKWTLILAKALIKLVAMSNPKINITGSGLIINALTGMITQNLSVKSFSDWKKFQSIMHDQHYTKKDIIVNCYSLNVGKKLPSNVIKNKQEMRDIITLENSTFKKKSNRRNSSVELGALKNLDEVDLEEQKIEQTYVEANLINGYSYCIGDYFDNREFNMVLAKQKSLKQHKLKHEYSEMSKVQLNNKSRQEKLEHRKKKKEIKEKLLIQEKKRLEQIKKPIGKYHFIKLLSDLVINCEYSNKQILLAKKCLLNGLECPPNYDMPSLQKQKQKQKQEPKQPKLGSTSAIKFKQQEINAPLDDFSTIENVKDLLPRADEGIWIKDQDLLTIFDEFQFYLNPNVFEFKSIEQVSNKIPGEFTTDENKQILVVEKKGNPHLDQHQQNLQGNSSKIALLFGFALQQSKFDTLCAPYCMLQKFDFESYRTANNIVTLNQPLSSTYLKLNDNNSVFRIYTISRGKYTYWISSDSKYKLVSMADYLTEYEAYSPKNFTIEYPALDKKSFTVLTRIKIKHEGDQNNIMYFKLKNCAKEVQKYLTLRVIQIPQSGQYTSEQIEGVIVKKQESMHLVYEYTRIQFKPNRSYCLVLEAYPPHVLPEGSFEMAVLSKLNSNYTIDQTEQIQPYKVVEKYTPNKYATILKERLFCNGNVNASLLLKIFQGQQGAPLATDKKASKKGGKDEPAFEVTQKQLTAKRLVHVKLFKNGQLIYYSKNYNQVIIPNIEFEKTKENIVYYLEASFDLREWSQAANVFEDTNKLYWSVQIMGEDAIAFVKDTLQEQKQKQIRKSWEDKQPGRAQKAKKARQKFLLELKQEKGEPLTEQQLQIVNAPRLTKKKMLEEEKKNQDKKGGKGAKKDDKKAGKDKKQEIVQQKQEQRPPPKSTDNFMKQIKQFLKNLQQCKVKKEELQEGQEPRIRSQEQQNSIKEGAIMAKQNRAAQIVRNIELREVMKIKQKDKKDKLTILLEDTRSNFNSQWKKYLQWRTQDQEREKSKQQKQKQLIDIISQEKPTISQADLIKLITEYRNVDGSNLKIADVGDMIRKNIKINNITEKINTALEGWEIEQLKGLLEEVKNDSIEGINEQTMSKVSSMMDEAAKNPAIVAEKQAEIKKTKKPGKK